MHYGSAYYYALLLLSYFLTGTSNIRWKPRLRSRRQTIVYDKYGFPKYASGPGPGRPQPGFQYPRAATAAPTYVEPAAVYPQTQPPSRVYPQPQPEPQPNYKVPQPAVRPTYAPTFPASEPVYPVPAPSYRTPEPRPVYPTAPPISYQTAPPLTYPPPTQGFRPPQPHPEPGYPNQWYGNVQPGNFRQPNPQFKSIESASGNFGQQPYPPAGNVQTSSGSFGQQPPAGSCYCTPCSGAFVGNFHPLSRAYPVPPSAGSYSGRISSSYPGSAPGPSAGYFANKESALNPPPIYYSVPHLPPPTNFELEGQRYR